jgi:GNAT superfamily N-acetyltransferase
VAVNNVTLRASRVDEAAMLSDLALRSKAHWGYSAEFIDACRAELTVHPADIAAGRVTVAEHDGVVIGMYVIGGDPPLGEIEDFFVEPEHIGAGLGGLMFAALRAAATEAGFERLRIDADPNALGFYEHQGAVQIGEQPSGSIPGRMLPLLELEL